MVGVLSDPLIVLPKNMARLVSLPLYFPWIYGPKEFLDRITGISGPRYPFKASPGAEDGLGRRLWAPVPMLCIQERLRLMNGMYILRQWYLGKVSEFFLE